MSFYTTQLINSLSNLIKISYKRNDEYKSVHLSCTNNIYARSYIDI